MSSKFWDDDGSGDANEVVGAPRTRVLRIGRSRGKKVFLKDREDKAKMLKLAKASETRNSKAPTS